MKRPAGIAAEERPVEAKAKLLKRPSGVATEEVLLNTVEAAKPPAKPKAIEAADAAEPPDQGPEGMANTFMGGRPPKDPVKLATFRKKQRLHMEARAAKAVGAEGPVGAAKAAGAGGAASSANS